MNKKILTKVLAFVLVICLLVPIIPDLGLDIGSVTASAAMPSTSNTAVLFKTGSANYWAASKTPIPKENDVQPKALYSAGSYYLPLGVVNTVTGASLSATDTFNGVGYVKVTHGGTVTGSWKTYISNMGFIQLTTGSNTISSASDAEQVAWIKANVFDHGSNSSAFSALENTDHPYLLTNQSQFDHLASVHKGENVGTYTGDVNDPTLKGYLQSLVGTAEAYYNKYSTSGTTDGALNNTWKTTIETMPYANNNGYDGGGRQGDATNYANIAETLAYAYQVTRDTKYAALALNISLGLAKWPHWGAGHFLNAADASYHMALVYDWCYDVWGDTTSESVPVVLNKVTDRNTVRDALFTKGVMAGIYDSLGSANATYESQASLIASKVTNYYRVNAWYNNNLFGGSDIYNTRENNWNGVCSSGMILAALALVGESGSVTGLTITSIAAGTPGTQTTTTIFNTANNSPLTRSYKTVSGFSTKTNYYTIENAAVANGTSVSALSTYSGACTWLINNNLYNLEQYGLAQYVPDGSYIESASYWSYGTNSIFRTIAALNSACGTDFGLSAAWGFDKTAYFANYAQDSNGLSWRYHDDNSSSIDTSMNSIFGAIIGDENLVGYRKYMIEKGAVGVSIYDTLSYDAGVTGFAKTELDYYMPGIEGYSMRSSWENDSAYVAFMGGSNMVNHGQVDSGAFVYHNNGVAWFQDIGTENYNSYGFGYGTQTNEDGESDGSGTLYYPQVAEGNNTLASSSSHFGQKWSTSATAAITEHGSNAYGGYAILNQQNVYNASSAQRAILMTNNRKTVVIQDEVTFNSSQTAYWIGHVYDSINITLSEDKQVAYLTDGQSTIRCTLIQPDGVTAGAFTVEDATVHHLSGTAANNYSATKYEEQGKTIVHQNDYSAWQKLVVEIAGTTSVKLAIAIEEVAVGDNYECGYTWTNIANWDESMLTPDDNNYDDKILLSKDFDIDGIGTFSSKNGNLRMVNTLVDGDNAMGAYFNSGNTLASNITLAAAAGKVASASIGNGMLVTEFDLMTASTLPDVDFALYGTDIYPIVSISAATLAGYIDTDWTHITMVLDEENDTFYVYADDVCIVKESFVSSSYENLKLVISSEDGEIETGSLLIDNVIIRTYTENYTDLDSTLAGSSVGAASGITSNWADSSYVAPEVFTGNVAKLYIKEVDAPLPDDDTPIIDFWSTAAVTNETQAGAELLSDDGTYVATFAELETAINSGAYTHVELYTTNVKEPISISKRIVVDTQGHKFVATSDNLICEISGDIHTYKAGSVKVAFIINGSTYYATYRNTTAATYQAPASAIGILKGIENDDGTHDYVVTAQDTWSLTPYGEVLTGNDLIVTSENKTFYLTGNPYSGYFLTVNGSTIRGYTDADDFFTVMAESTTYDKIIMTNNMYVSRNSQNNVNGTKNLYLNGYTITYDTPDTVASAHMFAVGSAVLNVYGPGVIDNDAAASNVVMRGSYGATPVTFNNLTIESEYTICDHREGSLEFNNCTIVGEKNRTLFSVSNRISGTNNGTTDVTKMAVLTINGGVINAPYNTGNGAPISVKDNARLVLKGGVVINAPSANAAVYVNHATPAVINGDTTGVDHMYIHLGEYYIDNCRALFVYEKSAEASAEADVDVSAHIYRVEGAGFATTTTDYPLASGYVLAKTGSAGYAYRVVKTEDAATVIWRHEEGDVQVEEKWVDGATPITDEGVKSYLAGLSPDSGKKYTCDLSELGGKGVVGGAQYTFLAKQITNLELRISMTLYSEFYVNIFVKYDANVTYNHFMINGERYEVADCPRKSIPGVEGEFYQIILKDISAKDAAELITVSVNINEDEEITAITSILNYANKLLASENQEAPTKKLMYSIVQYIGAAATYSGDRYTGASCKALLGNHTGYATDTSIIADAPDTSAVKDAVKSVYLDLKAAPTFAFRFQTSFSGTVTLSYVNVNGETVSVNVAVEDGKISDTEDSVYLLVMKAYDMASDITIKVGNASCTYNIDNYYTQAVQSADTLYDLVCALKSYCVNAKAYKA